MRISYINSGASHLGWDFILSSFDLWRIYELAQSIAKHAVEDPFGTAQSVRIEFESIWYNRYLEDAGLA